MKEITCKGTEPEPNKKTDEDEDEGTKILLIATGISIITLIITLYVIIGW